MERKTFVQLVELAVVGVVIIWISWFFAHPESVPGKVAFVAIFAIFTGWSLYLLYKDYQVGVKEGRSRSEALAFAVDYMTGADEFRPEK